MPRIPVMTLTYTRIVDMYLQCTTGRNHAKMVTDRLKLITTEVWTRIGNYSPLFQVYVITYQHSYSEADLVNLCFGFILLDILACRLLDTKPLSQPMLGYCQLDH